MGTEDLLLQPPERRPAVVSGAGADGALLTTGALMWVNFKKMFNKSVASN